MVKYASVNCRGQCVSHMQHYKQTTWLSVCLSSTLTSCKEIFKHIMRNLYILFLILCWCWIFSRMKRIATLCLPHPPTPSPTPSSVHRNVTPTIIPPLTLYLLLAVAGECMPQDILDHAAIESDLRDCLQRHLKQKYISKSYSLSFSLSHGMITWTWCCSYW